MQKLFSDDTLAHYGIEYEDENSLEHHGIRGQKWGFRNRASRVGSSARQLGTNLKENKPSAGNHFLTGRFGNKKHFTNPDALAERKKAGKLRVAAISTALASAAASTIGSKAITSDHVELGAGAHLVAFVLGGSSIGLEVGALKSQAKATNLQNGN